MRIIGLLIKVVLIAALLLAVVSYFVYLNTGKFWVPNLSFVRDNVSIPFSDDEPKMGTLQAPNEPIYKWREGEVWVYGNKPPEGVNATLITEINN